jgi:1,4-dihydroxy-2-naphthoate octaprenyltransferase
MYGQALAFAVHGAFRWRLFFAAQLFGLFDQLFIVFANDVADFASDSQNTTYTRYSGGSRVIPEGKLRPIDLAGAATVALFGMAAVCVHLVFREHRAFMVVIAAIAAHLLWMYSFMPFRLSYRGYGEVLHGLGAGVLLPLAGYYAQAGTVAGIGPATLLPGVLLGYAANVAGALGDAPSDAASGKRTLPVRRGERAARRTVLVAMAIAALLSPLAIPGAPVPWWPAFYAASAAALLRLARLSENADSTDRPRCERFTGAALGTIALLLVAWAVALATTRL